MQGRQLPVGAVREHGLRGGALRRSQWNGVAIASRVGLADVERTFIDQPVFGKNGKDAVQEARAIGATCGGVRVWSLYVPNGRALDDEHMPYKLSWLDALRTHAEGWVRNDPEAQIALMGDWNIAPQDDDVWDIDFFRTEGLTHVSEPGTGRLPRLRGRRVPGRCAPTHARPRRLHLLGLHAAAFPKKEGMRIDFVLASPALAARVTGAAIDREERKGKGASDHAPVIVELSD